MVDHPSLRLFQPHLSSPHLLIINYGPGLVLPRTIKSEQDLGLKKLQIRPGMNMRQIIITCVMSVVIEISTGLSETLTEMKWNLTRSAYLRVESN